MITIFTAPKAMRGDADRIQRNAIGSWLRLDPDVQVILVGDDPGVADAARELGAEHFGGVEPNEHGTPRLDLVFAAARDHARHRLLCFANADIVLGTDFAVAARKLDARFGKFLAVGESWDAPLNLDLSFDGRWEAQVGDVLAQARRRGAGALDFFLYTDDLFRELPPFAIGRIGFDNWLVWKAAADGAAVVDVTRAVKPLHQRHDYAHLRGGREATRHESPEGRRNLELARADGGEIFTRYDATHLLTPRGVRRNVLRPFHLKERARKALYRLRRLTPWPPRT
jgi:hypothetical protein